MATSSGPPAHADGPDLVTTLASGCESKDPPMTGSGVAPESTPSGPSGSPPIAPDLTAPAVELPPAGIPSESKPDVPASSPLPMYPVAAPAAETSTPVKDGPKLTLAGVRSKITDTLLGLARELRRADAPMRPNGFAMLAISQRCRPHIWHGGQRVDLVAHYMPAWLEHCVIECKVDAVVCALQSEDSGVETWREMDEVDSFRDCKQWIAGIFTGYVTSPCETDLQTAYSFHGVMLLGTEPAEESGPNVACKMLQLPEDNHTRQKLREDMSDALFQYLEKQWLHDLMAELGELDAGDVSLLRIATKVAEERRVAEKASAHADATVTAGAEASAHACAAVDAGAEASIIDDVLCLMPSEEEIMDALKWAVSCSTKKGGDNISIVATSLMQTLPESVLREQVRLHKENKYRPQLPAKANLMSVKPYAERSRKQAVEAFQKHLREHGAEDALANRYMHLDKKWCLLSSTRCYGQRNGETIGGCR